jgi:hypothetical protein
MGLTQEDISVLIPLQGLILSLNKTLNTFPGTRLLFHQELLAKFVSV